MPTVALRLAAVVTLMAALVLGLAGTALIVFRAEPVAHFRAAVLPGSTGEGPGGTAGSPALSPSPGSSPQSSSPDASPGSADSGPGGDAAAGGAGAGDQSGAGGQATAPGPPPPQFLEATQPGAYGWSTSGFENADGFQRDLPSQTTEYITRTGGDSISVHHVFSSQKESWLSLAQGSTAVVQTLSRSRVFFGPFGSDQTMSFNPPITVLLLPPAVGQSWSGSFSGSIYGTYTGTTFDHTTLTIGGEGVEVWAVRINVQFHGNAEGTSSHQTWFSPKYGVGVRDVWSETAASGGHNYHCEGSMTSNSVHPS